MDLVIDTGTYEWNPKSLSSVLILITTMNDACHYTECPLCHRPFVFVTFVWLFLSLQVSTCCPHIIEQVDQDFGATFKVVWAHEMPRFCFVFFVSLSFDNVHKTFWLLFSTLCWFQTWSHRSVKTLLLVQRTMFCITCRRTMALSRPIASQSQLSIIELDPVL